MHFKLLIVLDFLHHFDVCFFTMDDFWFSYFHNLCVLTLYRVWYEQKSACMPLLSQKNWSLGATWMLSTRPQFLKRNFGCSGGCNLWRQLLRYHLITHRRMLDMLLPTLCRWFMSLCRLMPSSSLYWHMWRLPSLKILSIKPASIHK